MKSAKPFQDWLRNKDLRVVSADSGINYNTLYAIKTGKRERITPFIAAELEAVMK